MYTKQYQDVNGSFCIFLHRDGEEWFIPPDTANRDYREYLAWVEAGNEPHIVEYIPPVVIDEPTSEERLAALELVVSMVFAEDDANV